MAQTYYGVNAPEAVKLWSTKLFNEAIRDTYVWKFMGKSPSSLLQLKTETEKSAGDKLTVTLRMKLSGDGVIGDDTLEGNEEALTTYTDSFYINQTRHAVRSGGKMSEQRIPFSTREEAKNGLRDWFAERYDTAFFNQLAGYTAEANAGKVGNNQVLAPSTNRILRPNSRATDQALVAGDEMTLSLIDKLVEMAGTVNPIIRPIRVNGEDKYVLFLHDYQVTDLRTSTSTGQWLDIQKAAMAGGNVKDNPIYTGALGEYNSVVLHKAARVPTGIHSTTGVAETDTRRAIFCGAQAGVIGFGQGERDGNKMSWVEKLFDYDNQLGVAAGAIFGLKKTRFNSEDFGSIVLATYAVKHY